MALTLLIVTLLVMLLISLLVLGGLLWLACRIVGINQATYRRAIVAVLFTAVVATMLGLAVVGVAGASVWAVPFLIGVVVAVPLLTVRRFLAPNLGRAVLACLLWAVFGVFYAAPVHFVLWLGFVEGFTVPTGAMAEAIEGYHKTVICPKCGHTFDVNASVEGEPGPSGLTEPVVGCTCPNCRWHIDLTRQSSTPELEDGDHILVTHGLLGPQALPPERYNVVVFRHPPSEHAKGAPMNYVKRLIGLPGETIGIHYGDLYVLHGVEPSAEDRAAPAHERWQMQFMHTDDLKESLEAHDQPAADKQRFTILRKPPDKLLTLRRLVYDNDQPAQDLANAPRWADAAGAWAVDQSHGFRHAAKPGEDAAWLRYRHLLRTSGGAAQVGAPQLITDFFGYNTWESGLGPNRHMTPTGNWVGDLILDCEVTVEQPGGSLVLELSEGVDRFRARFDLASGTCTLTRQALGEDAEHPLGEGKPTPLKQGGTHRVRFANVDERLTVWVGDALPFGDGVEYPAPARHGPTKENDLEPAGIAADGATVSIHKLKLWRDTYWTIDPGRADASLPDWSHPEEWEERDWKQLGSLPGRTLYVQPGHYLCLGDNSPESSDSRSWGLVPERLLIGRAVLTYAPFLRWRRFR